MRDRIEALVLLAAPFVLASLTGPPSVEAMTAATSDPSAPVVAALALVAWAGCGWLLLVFALDALATAGGRLDGLARRLAPGVVRSLMRVAAGTTTATLLVASPALAQVPDPAGSVAAVNLDWPSATPVVAVPTGAPTVTAPTVTAPSVEAAPVAAPHAARRHSETVVVRPGDSLWAIAARRAGPHPPAREIATTWPRWWRANRSAVGADPDLIHPGTVLHAPATTQGEP